MRELFRRGYMLVMCATILGMAAMLYSCESESDIEENESQKEDIVSYLEGSHEPLLIAESEIGESLYEYPDFYMEYGDFAYLYIEDYYNEARQQSAEIKNGSTVILNFRLYSFTGSAISDDELPVYTNEPIYEEAYIEAGLNTSGGGWNFSPMELVVGSTTLLTGIEQGLKLCREGDIIEIYLTRNMAYGDDVIGLVDQWSSLVFFGTILSVEN